MGGEAGNVWLELGGATVERWMIASGVLLLRDGTELRGNDCVLLAGLSSLYRRIREGMGGGGLGGNAAASVSPWLMNRTAVAFSTLPVEEIERRLQREGIAATLDGDSSARRAVTARRYSVAVFDLTVAEVRRIYKSSSNIINDINYLSEGQCVSATVDERLRNIIAKAAVRALYLLGLDFGQVEVELDDWGRATIVEVNARIAPSPVGEYALGEVVAAFAEAWAEETQRGVEVTLGADPEFIMLAPDGKVVPASRYLPREGDAGCDSIVVRGVRHWPLAELRPAPASEPSAVAADLRRLLASAARRTAGAKLTWRAGAGPVRGLPLGGHVHISGAALTSERLRALDNAVALPLRLLEPPSAAARRPRFGALGDFRRQSHGGFEYRTPPSWLVSPRLARGALALAKVAAEHARELASSRPLDEDAVRDAFYSGDREALLAGATAVHEALAKTRGYRVYEPLIEPLFRSIARGATWNETADLRERWGISVT